VQRDSGNTSTAARNLQQCFESVNSIPFAGKTVTLSFYARAGANYSDTSNLLTTQWVWGTGTDQNLYLAGYTGQTNISATTSVTLTTTWQRFTITGTVGATATEIALNFNYGGVGTAGANDYFEVTGVQMEVGSVATPFKTYAATIQEELAACRRYLPALVGNAAEVGVGMAFQTNAGLAYIKFDTVARVAPTGITATGNWRWYALNTGTVAGVGFNAANVYGASLTSNTNYTITAGQATRLYGDDSSATILFTGCEL
jgi:hypothetical protein